MLVFAFYLTALSSCGKSSKEQLNASIENLSFRNIPGVTQNEINAIEALKTKYGSFTCAVNPNTDSFYSKDGELSGFAILFYDWLSGFFGIPFKPEFYEWGNLIKKLDSCEVDFTIELAESPKRRAVYFMTSPIAKRTIKIYRIKGAEPLSDITNSRPPQYAFPVESVLADKTAAKIKYSFEIVFVDSHADAYPLLKSGEIDAYIAMDSIEAVFDVYGNVDSEFFPP